MAVRVFEAQEHLNCPRLKRFMEETECDPYECNEANWNFNGEDVKGCLVKTITQQSGEFIRVFRFYKNGILPRPGGLLDQGNRYIEAMEAIDREINLISKEKEDKGK